ncbi:hypothetical protein LG315_10535 [Microbacterium marinum]|uniref:hypothetical protein n=1 Tax=Microbacterium marinum TaxID=421115 RepID=UPI0038508B46
MRKITNTLTVLASSLFALVAVSDGIARLFDGTPAGFLNHETAFVAILVLCLTPTRGRRLIQVLTLGALILSTIRYPSATTALAVAGAALTWGALKTSRNAVIALAAGIAGLAAALLPRAEQLLQDFYTQVGRVNNTATREMLWGQAEGIIERNPLVGGGAREPITGLAHIYGQTQFAPFHQSFLTFGVVGGVTAIAILISLLITTLGTAVFSRRDKSSFKLSWAPALAAGAICLTVNPILERVDTSLIFAVLTICAFARHERSACDD